MAKLALTLAWSTASNMFLLSIARVCAAASICFLHSSFKEVMAFCWASRILLISSAMSLFSSFWVPSICRAAANKHGWKDTFSWMTCHRRKSTSVNNELKDDLIVFSCSSFSVWVLVLFMMTHCHTIMTYWDT